MANGFYDFVPQKTILKQCFLPDDLQYSGWGKQRHFERTTLICARQ